MSPGEGSGTIPAPHIEVQERDGLFWLLVNGVAIGSSKNQFDADHVRVMLRKALRIEPLLDQD